MNANILRYKSIYSAINAIMSGAHKPFLIAVVGPSVHADWFSFADATFQLDRTSMPTTQRDTVERFRTGCMHGYKTGVVYDRVASHMTRKPHIQSLSPWLEALADVVIVEHTHRVEEMRNDLLVTTVDTTFDIIKARDMDDLRSKGLHEKSHIFDLPSIATKYEHRDDVLTALHDNLHLPKGEHLQIQWCYDTQPTYAKGKIIAPDVVVVYHPKRLTGYYEIVRSRYHNLLPHLPMVEYNWRKRESVTPNRNMTHGEAIDKLVWYREALERETARANGFAKQLAEATVQSTALADANEKLVRQSEFIRTLINHNSELQDQYNELLAKGIRP